MLRKVLVLACAALALGAGAVFCLREDADARFERALGDRPLAALLDETPALDQALQERLWRLIRSDEPWSTGHAASPDDDWYLSGEESPPASFASEHERLRPAMTDLTEILATDRACLTSIGWIDRGPQRGRAVLQGWRLRNASWPMLRAAAHWYAHEALCADEPTLALSRLRQLCVALSHPGTVRDRVGSALVGWVRDRTHLMMLLRGRIASDLVEAWLSEPCREIEVLAQGVRLERALYATTVGEDLERERHLDWSEDIDLEERVRLWWQGKGEVAAWLELCDAFEAYLRGADSAEHVRSLEADVHARNGSPLVMRHYHAALLDEALLGNARHRLARTAGRVLQLHRQRGRLPADATELRKWMAGGASLLDHGTLELAVTYERLSESAFRVRVDPDTPTPDLLPASAMDRVREEQGQRPMRTGALRWHLPHVMELHVPRQ
ncbi:MAG: hypothetical protein AB7T63_13290 [Planctomycetota bacterium]